MSRPYGGARVGHGWGTGEAPGGGRIGIADLADSADFHVLGLDGFADSAGIDVFVVLGASLGICEGKGERRPLADGEGGVFSGLTELGSVYHAGKVDVDVKQLICVCRGLALACCGERYVTT